MSGKSLRWKQNRELLSFTSVVLVTRCQGSIRAAGISQVFPHSWCCSLVYSLFFTAIQLMDSLFLPLILLLRFGMKLGVRLWTLPMEKLYGVVTAADVRCWVVATEEKWAITVQTSRSFNIIHLAVVFNDFILQGADWYVEMNARFHFPDQPEEIRHQWLSSA